MANQANRVTVAIPTFRRPDALARMLRELRGQTRLPDGLIVVDGEGGAGRVRGAVAASGWPERAETLLIPSTRANLPFQRWLARRAAGAGALIFFDDDLLLPDRRTVERLACAVESAAAATCQVRMPPGERLRWRLDRVGPLRRLRAGKAGAGGARHMPLDGAGELADVEWLRGAAMAFRAEALPPESFPADLFALAETGAGMGEDLALASLVCGRIALVRGLEVEHPGDHPSRTLPERAERQGFAIAYSRRLLRDLRDGGWGPLAVAWAGGLSAAALDWLRRAGPDRFAFLTGYFRGVAHGAFRPPRHERLTPAIDWEREARESLERAINLTKEAPCPAASV